MPDVYKRQEYVLASETANAGRVLVSRTQLAGQQQTAAAVAHLTRALEGCKCSRRFAPEEIITKMCIRDRCSSPSYCIKNLHPLAAEMVAAHKARQIEGLAGGCARSMRCV